MKIEIFRNSIQVVPESIIDESFIEKVLGMTTDGQEAQYKRVNVMGLGTLAYIAISKQGDK